MNGLLHAWLLAFILAAVLAAVILLPAAIVGIRLRLVEMLEAVCWLTLGVVALAEVTAVA